MSPARFQLQRRRGWRMPLGAKSCARPSRWGNPFVVGGPIGGWLHPGCRLWRADGRIESVEHAIAMYRAYVQVHFVPVKPEATPHKGIYGHGIESLASHARRLLGGRDLGCYCALDQLCHVDELLELANPGWTP